MHPLNHDEVQIFVKANIEDFLQHRLNILEGLQLPKLLKQRNPYIFKAKNIAMAYDLVINVLDRYLSSQEEDFYDSLLKKLAIYVNFRVYEGKISRLEGIDLEFCKDGIDYIVSIKPNPGCDSSEDQQLVDNFEKAKYVKRGNNPNDIIMAVYGCCYGIDNHPEKDGYTKLCGQRFWEFISGNRELYVQIIEPLGHKAKEKNEEFLIEYGRIINVFEAEFLRDYCPDGRIDWEKLIRLNSGTD